MSDVWMTGGDAYLPLLNAAEISHKIPTNLLARIAYQECRWREDIISDQVKSRAECIGLMQLNPVYFPDAGKSVPNDIDSAATLLSGLFARFGDWQVAVAAYNWGGGNVHHAYAMDADEYELKDMPPETRNYVTQVCGDVPVPGILLQEPPNNG